MIKNATLNSVGWWTIDNLVVAKVGNVGKSLPRDCFDYYACDTDEYDGDNNNSEDPPRDHDLPPTCSIASLAGPAGDEMVIF